MREFSSPRVDQSTRCPVRELAYPRVVQLPLRVRMCVCGLEALALHVCGLGHCVHSLVNVRSLSASESLCSVSRSFHWCSFRSSQSLQVVLLSLPAGDGGTGLVSDTDGMLMSVNCQNILLVIVEHFLHY